MPDPFLYIKGIGSAALVSAAAAGMLLLILRKRLRSVSQPGGESASTSGSTTSIDQGPFAVVTVAAIGLGLAAGCYAMDLRWHWPPVNGLDRLLTIVAPAALLVEMLSSLRKTPRWGAWTLRLGLAAMTPRILLHGSVYLSGSAGAWPLWQMVLTLAACGGVLAAVWVLLVALFERSSGVSISIVLGMTTLCAGLTVMMAGYLNGGAFAFPLVAALVTTSAATCLASPLLPAPQSPAGVGFGVVSLFGLVFVGRFFGELSTVCALTLLLTPLLCWASELHLLRSRKPWLIGSVRIVLVAIPLAIVLVVAKREFDLEMGPLL